MCCKSYLFRLQRSPDAAMLSHLGRLEFLDVFQSDQGELQLLVPMKMAILGQALCLRIKAGG